ncbi:MAG: Xaa-Pro peptidase family protein [Desulfobacteraceae bacterium]|nr:Xaa-Pro peptidase family protein [Desulfobacteraceae bacterium]
MYPTNLNTPKVELEKRVFKLKIYLQKNNIDGALILQRVDLFYFTGTIQQAHLYVPAHGDPLLMVRKSYDRAKAESSIEKILPLKRPSDIPNILKANGHAPPTALGLELDVLPTNLFFNFQGIFGNPEVVDISQAIRLIRAVKSPYEIDIMRRAAELSDQVAGWVPKILREGMTEIELAGKIEAEARRLGHQGVVRMRLWGSEMFYGHLMSGPTGAVPSFLSSPTGGAGASPAVAQGPGFKTIQPHEPVLVDYVFAYNGYLSDHARIFSLGSLPEELMEAHAAMLEIEQMIKRWAKPGVKSGEIYKRALEKTKALGYADHFMGVGPERIRFVGHGIGLEVDEFPFLAAGQQLELQAGMAIALEPKLIFPGKGVVGIENTHVVTDDGLDQLGQFPGEVLVL